MTRAKTVLIVGTALANDVTILRECQQRIGLIQHGNNICHGISEFLAVAFAGKKLYAQAMVRPQIKV